MADPAIEILDTDLRIEDRSGCLILVDPLIGDIASAWPDERPDLWRWRVNRHQTGAPYPSGDRTTAIEGMISCWFSIAPRAAERLAEQRSRFSFGYPQIVKH